MKNIIGLFDKHVVSIMYMWFECIWFSHAPPFLLPPFGRCLRVFQQPLHGSCQRIKHGEFFLRRSIWCDTHDPLFQRASRCRSHWHPCPQGDFLSLSIPFTSQRWGERWGLCPGTTSYSKWQYTAMATKDGCSTNNGWGPDGFSPREVTYLF